MVSGRNAGYYQTNATATNSNYNVTVNQGTLTINKAALTLSAAADTKVYDGTTASSQTVGASGLQGTDTVAATQVFNSSNVLGANATNVSGYTISDQNGGNNYTVTLNTNTGTITPAPLNIAINSPSTTYGTVKPLTYTVSGLVNGENSSAAGLVLPLTTTGYTSNSTTNNIGQYQITSGAASVGSNYSINAIVNGTLSITPATLTFTATGNSKIVTTSDPTLTYSTSGLVNGDSASVITQAPTLTRAPGEVAGSYAISMSGGNAGSNYTIVNRVPSGTDFTIVGASQLLITMNGVTTTYGTLGTPTVSSAKYLDANNNVIYTLTNTSGNAWSDGVGGAITITPTLSGVSVTTSVGTVAGVVTNTNSGIANSSGNFTSVFTQVNNYTVNQAPLTITAANVARTYDGTNFSSPSASAVGLMNNETLSSLGGVVFSGTAINSRNAGVYSINPTAAAPSNFSNYSITYQNGRLTTNQANLVLSAGSDSKVYDGTTLSTVIPTSSQLLVGDTISNLTQSFASKNVLGTNASTLNVNSGYTINDGNQGNNYVVTYRSNTGTITPLATTVTINSNAATYNGRTQSLNGYSISNLIVGDSLNVVGDAIAGRNAGSYTSAATAVNSNYAITMNQGTLTINQAPLTLSAAADTKVYDGTITSSGTPAIQTGSQLFAGDAISNLTQSFASKDVLGTNGSTLNVNPGYNISDGNNGGNYAVVTRTNMGTITPKVLTTTLSGVSKTYDGTTSANVGTGNLSVATGVVNESFTVSNTTGVTASYADPNVLNNQGSGAVTASGLLMSMFTPGAGTNSTNYSVLASLTANVGTITKANASITANGLSSTYDGVTTYAALTTNPGFSASGLVANDAVASVGTTAIQSGSTIGAGSTLSGVAQAGTFNYSIGGAQGSGLSNYAITYVGNTGNVARANLNLTGATSTVTYNGQTQGNTYTMTNSGVGALNSGNALGADSLVVTGMASGRNVLSTGSYADQLQVSAGANTSLSNYNITIQDGSLTLNPLTLNLVLTGAYTGSTLLKPTSTTLQGVNGQTIGFTSANIAYSAVSANGTNYVTSLNGLSVSGGTGTLSLSNYTIPGMTSLASNVGGTFSNSPGAANSVTLTTPSNSQNVNPVNPVHVPGSSSGGSKGNVAVDNFVAAGLTAEDGILVDETYQCESTDFDYLEICFNKSNGLSSAPAPVLGGALAGREAS